MNTKWTWVCVGVLSVFLVGCGGGKRGHVNYGSDHGRYDRGRGPGVVYVQPGRPASKGYTVVHPSHGPGKFGPGPAVRNPGHGPGYGKSGTMGAHPGPGKYGQGPGKGPGSGPGYGQGKGGNSQHHNHSDNRSGGPPPRR